MLLVFSPWNAPIPMTRAWCIYEMMCAIEENVLFHVNMPLVDLAAFLESLSDGEETPDVLTSSGKIITRLEDVLTRVNAENMESQNANDHKMIKETIEKTCGFPVLNSRIKKKMKEVLLNVAAQEGRKIVIATAVVPVDSSIQHFTALTPRMHNCVPTSQDLRVLEHLPVFYPLRYFNPSASKVL